MPLALNVYDEPRRIRKFHDAITIGRGDAEHPLDLALEITG